MKKNIAISDRAGSFFLKLLSNGHRNPPDTKKISGKDKYLIINGDDLCRDEKTNNAIITAYVKGILTSTSAFINLDDSVRQLKDIHYEYPRLPIGLHLNLTQGSPVAGPGEVVHLADSSGKFYDIDNILYHLADMPVEEVKKEFYAQVELFLSTGVPLDHINYHFHLAALYTPFFEIVRDIAREYKIPVRNPVPISIYDIINLQINGGGGGSHAGVKKLIRFGITQPGKLFPMIKKVQPAALVEQERLMFLEGIKSTDWFVDSFFRNASVKNFISILEQLPGGVTELMCHPAFESELNVLTDRSVKEKTEELGIKLISWNHLKQHV